MKKPFNLTAIAARLGGFLLLLLITLAVILWVTGVYDLSFIERPVHDTTEPSETAEPVTEETTEPPEETAALPARYESGAHVNSLYQAPLPQTDAESLAALDTMLAAFPRVSLSSAQGNAVYQPGTSRLLLADQTLPSAFSYSEWAVRSVRKEVINAQGQTTFSVEYENTPQPAVTLAGGWLFIDGEDGCSVYNMRGELCLSGYDRTAFEPTNIDDGSRATLFRSPDGSYYRLADGAFTAAAHDPALDKWQLTCELPLGYQGDGSTTVYCENEQYGYLAADGHRLTDPIYLAAFAHRDGYAIAYTADTVVILDASCAVVTSIPYETDDVLLTDAEVTIPQTFGDEYFGLNTVDHGLSLFRTRRSPYSKFIQVKVSDDGRLFNLNGTQMPLPQGYELLGYSDGMLLLRADGAERYGYMNYLGNFVADPVLSDASVFTEGLAAVQAEDGKMGLIDINGTVVLPVVFDYVSPISRGCCAAYSASSGWHIFILDESGAVA